MKMNTSFKKNFCICHTESISLEKISEEQVLEIQKTKIGRSTTWKDGKAKISIETKTLVPFSRKL